MSCLRPSSTTADTFPYLGLNESNIKVQSFDFSHHRALRRVRIWTPATFDPDWIGTAVSSIPKPSSMALRALPLRIELHISLPQWMSNPGTPEPYNLEKVDKLIASWTAIDTQLSRLIGFDPDAPSVMTVTDDATAGISLDISVPDLSAGPGKGVAALMFPLLSDIKGLVRLV